MGLKPRARLEGPALRLQLVAYSSLLPELRVPRLDEDDSDLVMVCEGDLRIENDLQIDYDVAPLKHTGHRVVGLLIRGNLEVGGCVLNYQDDENSPFLQVDGDLKARAFATGSSCIDILGTLRADCVLGVYNHGSVKTKQIDSPLVATEHSVSESGERTGYTLDGGPVRYFAAGVEDASRECDIVGVFHKGLLSGQAGDQWLDFNKAQSWLAKGREILRTPFVSIEEQASALVRRRLSSAPRVKELDLGHKNLPALPKELSSFTNLELLDAGFNALRALPESIRGLCKLRTLNLCANKLTELPGWIGDLSELRKLDLSSNWGLTHLPDSIGDLENLEELNLNQTSIQALPESLKGCKQLRTVKIGKTVYPKNTAGTFMTLLPEVLTQLPALEQLEISSSLLSTLPTRAFASKTLKTVNAKDTPLVTTTVTHPKIKPAKSNAEWPIEQVCRFWLAKPSYDSRKKRYRTEVLASRIPAIVAILDSAAAPIQTIRKRIDLELDEIVVELDSQGDIAFVVRETFGAALGALASVSATRELHEWLTQKLSGLSRYQTPVCPNAVFHLVAKSDVNKYRKLGITYPEYHQETYGTKVSFCTGHEVLPLANERFPAKAKVLAWEFDSRKLKEDPATFKKAFRQGTWLPTTDFGFALSRRYWGPQPWRN